MEQQSSAIIFLADNYKVQQTYVARSIRLFPVTGFNNLVDLKDETLAAGAGNVYHFEGAAIILPVVGTLVFGRHNEKAVLDCGELLVVGGASVVEVTNPYADGLINYLVISLKATFDRQCTYKYAFDLDANKNEMLEILKNTELAISIGKFEMRREATVYTATSKASFCFVVQGSFEIEGRLLHHRDALGVWETDQLDIESLGKESIIFLIEQPITHHTL